MFHKILCKHTATHTEYPWVKNKTKNYESQTYGTFWVLCIYLNECSFYLSKTYFQTHFRWSHILRPGCDKFLQCIVDPQVLRYHKYRKYRAFLLDIGENRKILKNIGDMGTIEGCHHYRHDYHTTRRKDFMVTKINQSFYCY